MSPELASNFVFGAGIGLLAWSLRRNLANLDTKLDGLTAKVDLMATADKQTQVRLTELDVRLNHVEDELAAVKTTLNELR